MTTTDTMHPFESAGLGKAPFRFAGHEHRVGPILADDGVTQVGAPGQPMGTCDHCGMSIADCYSVRSAEGKQFIVGSTCVEKLYRHTNKRSSVLARDPVYREFKREKNRIATERRHAREAARIAEGREWVESHEAALRSLPNPHREGETRWDQYQWYMLNAGSSGKLHVLKVLRRLLETP